MRLQSGLIALIVMLASAGQAQEFTTLKGHGGPIMGVAISPEGQVATASFDNALGVWTGREPRWLDGHDAAVTALAYTPDGMLVSGSDDFTVRLWEDGDPSELGRHRGKVSDIQASPDGQIIASASWDGTVSLWPRDGGAPNILDDLDGAVNAILFSEDGSSLYVATAKGDLWRYDLSGATSPEPLVRHGFGLNRMVLGDGWLAYGAVDGVTRVMDTNSGKPVADFTLERRPILSIAHHADSNSLAVGDGHGYIMMIDTGTWRISRDFKATREGPIWALAFSLDGDMIFAGGIDDVAYGWPVDMLGEFEPAQTPTRSFLRDASTMSNGERQFMRKCSICHDTDAGASRKAGPNLYGVFGRRAGTHPGYNYSPTLDGSDIVWAEDTIDALFDEGPDHYIPGSKMPMQRIAKARDRKDLINYLKTATGS